MTEQVIIINFSKEEWDSISLERQEKITKQLKKEGIPLEIKIKGEKDNE